MSDFSREMAKTIREETDGAVQIQIFPGSQLGSDTCAGVGSVPSTAQDLTNT